MHRYTEYTICDACGKVLKDGDKNSVFSERSHRVIFFKGFQSFDYDFCNNCAKEAKKALDYVCDKTVNDGTVYR